MAAVITPIASSPPILDPSPSPAPTAADSSPCIEGNRQNALSASIEAGYQNQKQRRRWVLNKHKTIEEIFRIFHLGGYSVVVLSEIHLVEVQLGLPSQLDSNVAKVLEEVDCVLSESI